MRTMGYNWLGISVCSFLFGIKNVLPFFLLQKFKNFEFGEIEISELHLSVRYSSNTKGYYSASTIVKLT